jgi:5'-methylthioadenosine phosphorylase
MTIPPPEADLLLLLAVVLPPRALDVLGPVMDERFVSTAYGDIGPLALRRSPSGRGVWVQPYSGLPSRTDPRSTLLAARKLGVQRVLNWDTAIALNPLLSRGQPVIVADYIDFVRHQPHTFFESEGITGIHQSPPVCPQMSESLAHALPMAPGGVYVGVDGPRRETAAEARMFRLWGGDLLGYNLIPEIALAGELALCYAGVTTVTETSADRSSVAGQGEIRVGLELVLEALPRFVEMLDAPTHCTCAQRLNAPRNGGLLADEWWRQA